MGNPLVIPVRSKRGRKRHARPQASGGELTLCGRQANGLVVDDAFPDCKRCCALIAKLCLEVVA